MARKAKTARKSPIVIHHTPRRRHVFPWHLRQGSSGSAVNILGLLMLASGYGNRKKIKLDGEYTNGGQIAKEVKQFQHHRNKSFGTKLTESGDFDRETQLEYKRVTGIDVRSLRPDMFESGNDYHVTTLKDMLDLLAHLAQGRPGKSKRRKKRL